MPPQSGRSFLCHTTAGFSTLALHWLSSLEAQTSGQSPFLTRSDQPIAALLKDLKARGLLDETVVLWTTEFGRTPYSQGGKGRDHNGNTFVSWMAGGGVKGGATVGQSDDFSFHAAEGATMCYDQHATLLHLLGLDFERLSFRHHGANRLLTDVHGRVLTELLS